MDVQKDFDGWNEIKKNINLGEELIFFPHQREVWWCVLGVNIGHEQDGVGSTFRRPVLILKRLSKTTCLVVPLTRSNKRNYHRISLGGFGRGDGQAITSQIRVIDMRRLIKKMGYLDENIFSNIQKSVREML